MNKESKNNKTEQAVGISLHFKELRKRLVVIAIAFVIVALGAFQFAPTVVEHFVDIAVNYGYKLIYLAPAELFGQYIKVTLIVTVSVLLPLILYQIWAFCRPGLNKRENSYFVRAIIFGFLSFIVGVVFAYYTIMPFMLQFFYEVNASSQIVANISVANYVSFILSTLLMFGAVFEMPVVITILTGLGVLSSSLLVKGRKIVIVIIFFVCAIITPPDIVSQIMVAIPMILLYEISTRISAWIERRKEKKES